MTEADSILWRATGHLRILRPARDAMTPDRLQQKWISAEAAREEWRDVPVVTEAPAEDEECLPWGP